MARLPDLTRDQLKSEDQQYFDEILGSRGSVRGPYGVLLHSPKLAARVANTGTYVRFESEMANGLKEVVIITTAREIKSQYEFTAHARLAREANVSDATIKAIADGTAPQGLSGDEELLERFTQQLLRDHKVSDTNYNEVKDRFGVQGIVDVTGLIGHYLLVGQFLAVFDVELAPGIAPALPL